jgi:hypothetical protein
MKYSVATTEQLNKALLEHLARDDGQEDLCFALWRPSRGRARLTALVHRLVLPIEGERQVHGNVSLYASYFERVLGEALEEDSGVAFLHSHPAHGWQAMSRDDMRAERRMAPSVLGATGLELLGMTVAAGDGAWSARFWTRSRPKQYRVAWAESVRVVGEHVVAHFNDRLLKPPGHQPTLVRTESAWGQEAQATLARLKVGVIGLGSVGSIIAEALARTGVQRVQLLDYQALEEVNLDRTLHAYRRDATLGRRKVDVSARAIRRSAATKGFKADAALGSVCENEGYRRALDCDVIFSCVDRPWGRSVLNYIAYAHLIPVIDGGIFVTRTRRGKLRGADWKAHSVGPGHRCLLCLGQYDPALVAADQRGDLEDPRYLESLPDDHPAKANENVFAFSLAVASLELMQWIMLIIAPLGLSSAGPQNYHLTTGSIEIGPTTCDQDCVFPTYVACGDLHHAGVGEHGAAQAARRVASSGT